MLLCKYAVPIRFRKSIDKTARKTAKFVVMLLSAQITLSLWVTGPTGLYFNNQ